MSFVDDTQILFEVFTAARHMGPERVKPPPPLAAKLEPIELLQRQRLKQVKIDAELAFDEEICTYSWAKEQLEADYPEKNLIFCKDMAYGLQGKYDMLPKGYKHTFLIRHPHKVFISHKKMMSAIAQLMFGKPEFRMCDLPSFMFAPKYGFGEQFELYEYIKANIDPSPVIIDADDLLSNPKSVLSQYFKAIGVQFTEDLLTWPSGLEVLKKWRVSHRFLCANMLQTGGFYDAALSSTQFNPPKQTPSFEELPEDVIPCVEASMPFYDQMYEMRLKP